MLSQNMTDKIIDYIMSHGGILQKCSQSIHDGISLP